MYWTPEDYTHPLTKAVRATADLQAIVLKKASDKTTKIQAYSKVDPQVKMIPQSFIQLGSKESGFMIRHLVKQVEKAEAQR